MAKWEYAAIVSGPKAPALTGQSVNEGAILHTWYLVKPADVELVRKWTNRYTAVAFVAQSVPLPDAFRCAQQRSATMAAIAERIGRADPDLKVYAKGQLDTESRIQAA